LGSQTKMLEVGRRRFVTFGLSTLDFSTRIRRNKARMSMKTKDRGKTVEGQAGVVERAPVRQSTTPDPSFARGVNDKVES